MKKVIMFVLTAMVLSSCSDFIDLKPIDFPTEETFYKDVKGLEGAVWSEVHDFDGSTW